jgi:hypothetical protein
MWRLVNPLGVSCIESRTRRQLIILARLVWPPVCFAMCTMINPSALPNRHDSTTICTSSTSIAHTRLCDDQACAASSEAGWANGLGEDGALGAGVQTRQRVVKLQIPCAHCTNRTDDWHRPGSILHKRLRNQERVKWPTGSWQLLPCYVCMPGAYQQYRAAAVQRTRQPDASPLAATQGLPILPSSKHVPVRPHRNVARQRGRGNDLHRSVCRVKQAFSDTVLWSKPCVLRVRSTFKKHCGTLPCCKVPHRMGAQTKYCRALIG